MPCIVAKHQTIYLKKIKSRTDEFLTNITLSQIPLLRWGLVPCIVAKHAMSAGEEAFVWYGYDLDFCPDW